MGRQICSLQNISLCHFRGSYSLRINSSKRMRGVLGSPSRKFAGRLAVKSWPAIAMRFTRQISATRLLLRGSIICSLSRQAYRAFILRGGTSVHAVKLTFGSQRIGAICTQSPAIRGGSDCPLARLCSLRCYSRSGEVPLLFCGRRQASALVRYSAMSLIGPSRECLRTPARERSIR